MNILGILKVGLIGFILFKLIQVRPVRKFILGILIAKGSEYLRKELSAA